MKADIHPKLNPVVFIDSSNETEFLMMSTLTSKETKKIDGVEYYVVRVDISSASHPFYTGKQVLVDTAGRVDKFRAFQEKAAKKKAEITARSSKKVKDESVEEKLTRKAAEKEAEKAEKKATEAVKKKASAKKAAEKVTVKKS